MLLELPITAALYCNIGEEAERLERLPRLLSFMRSQGQPLAVCSRSGLA